MPDPDQAEAETRSDRGFDQINLPIREDMYRRILDLGNLIPWIADAQGRVVACGDRWRDWTGADASESLGEGWFRFIHPSDRDRAIVEWRTAMLTNARFEGEWRIRMSDGSYRWCRAHAAKGVEEEGDPCVWYGMLEDVHDRHLAAEEFQRAQDELSNVSRLSAMGAMATAIAHDLNQPLTAVVHYVRGARKLLDQVEGDGSAELTAALADADKSAVRASDIVRRAREFVRRGTVEARREDLSTMIDEACQFATVDAAKRGVTWRVEHKSACQVVADRVQIQQVVVNLIRNAIEAMEGQPTRELTITSGQGAPGFCEVSVSDTGRGFSAEGAARMFDPFFTTHQEGMGVGLPISRMIVEAHGGSIWLDSPPDTAARIKFSLPRAPEPRLPS